MKVRESGLTSHWMVDTDHTMGMVSDSRSGRIAKLMCSVGSS